jgi:tetratricopeptide (TPR) repeat protein
VTKRKVRQFLGLSGLVALVLGSLPWIIVNWQAVIGFPPIAAALHYLTQKPLPKASRGMFAIALVHLEGDSERQFQDLIVENLKDFEGIQILQFDRTITVEGTKPSESQEAGYRMAQSYLRDSGADVLIWGIVIRHEGKAAARLYWTTSRYSRRSSESYHPVNFKLPELFWGDLVQVLRLVIVTYKADAIGEGVRPIVEELGSYIGKIRSLLEGTEGQGWTISTRAQVRFCFAYALLVLGAQGGSNAPLEEAIQQYRNVLSEINEIELPREWAATQNGLGMALSELGRRKSDTTLLQESVKAYGEALTVRRPDSSPYDWAITQNDLGIALLSLGVRERGTARLSEAVAAQRRALTFLSRENTPLDWGMVQHNLGDSLAALAERTSSPAYMLMAVSAQRKALNVFNPDEAPIAWASTQLSLASSLRKLGDQEGNYQNLTDAIVAINAALRVYTRGKLPLEWAYAQDNLGNALNDLGERESGTSRLNAAIDAHRKALEVLTRDKTPLDWAEAEMNLAVALTDLGKREKKPGLICDGIVDSVGALQVFSNGAPGYMLYVKANLESELEYLRENFPASDYERCVRAHPGAKKTSSTTRGNERPISHEARR